MPFLKLTKEEIKKIANSPVIYDRGRDYFQTKAVTKIWLEDATLHAKVLGRREYHVWLKAKNGSWAYDCNCPYEGPGCKHIVAVALTFLNQKERILKQAEKSSQQQSTLKDQLAKLNKDDLVDLLISSLKTHKNWKQTFLKTLAQKLEESGQSQNNQPIYQEEFYCLFDNICSILEEHNTYGGGPEEDEDEVYEDLEKIVQLFEEGKIKNEKIKEEFIKKMFYYYDWGNSGFVDVLMDTIFAVCQAPQDWQFVIQKLEAKEGDYRKKLVIQIYKDHLQDEEQYLTLRKQKLRHGSDYYDLAMFYHQRGKIQKALEIAQRGVEKAEGWTTDLLEFLFDYYQKCDYTKALFYLKKIFEEEPGLENYQRLKKLARTKDWEELDQWCRKILQKTQKDYQLALIHLKNKEYDRALRYVLSSSSPYGDFFSDFEKEEIAEKILPFYPQQLLPFYQQKVQAQIERKSRKAYREAVDYAKTVKKIYLKYLRQPAKWKSFIRGLRGKYENRPALIEELGVL